MTTISALRAAGDSGIGDSGVLDLLSVAATDSTSALALVVAGAALGSGSSSEFSLDCSVRSALAVLTEKVSEPAHDRDDEVVVVQDQIAVLSCHPLFESAFVCTF